MRLFRYEDEALARRVRGRASSPPSFFIGNVMPDGSRGRGESHGGDTARDIDADLAFHR